MANVLRFDPLRVLRRRYGSLADLPRRKRRIAIDATLALAVAAGFGIGWLIGV